MILAINFADGKYEETQHFNSERAKWAGVDKVIEYGKKDIDQDFYLKNKDILDEPTGAGLWLWKPYLIKKSLEQIEDGDYLIYSDAGSCFVNKVKHLVDCFEKQGEGDIMLFTLQHPEKMFTKRDVFITMACDSEEYTDSPQFLATYCMFRKSKDSVAFVDEWLKYSCDKKLIDNEANVLGMDNYPEFLANRNDQSILSLLAKKKGIVPFRDPSQYGFEEGYADTVGTKILGRSLFPQVFESHRGTDITHWYQLNYRSWYKWFDPDRCPAKDYYRILINKIKK